MLFFWAKKAYWIQEFIYRCSVLISSSILSIRIETVFLLLLLTLFPLNAITAVHDRRTLTGRGDCRPYDEFPVVGIESLLTTLKSRTPASIMPPRNPPTCDRWAVGRSPTEPAVKLRRNQIKTIQGPKKPKRPKQNATCIPRIPIMAPLEPIAGRPS